MGQFKQLTNFLVGLGVDKVGHSGKSFLTHLIGVYKFMEAQGCSPELCEAGMFHSIYGTELFQDFKLPVERRPEVRALIGERAECLAYINCVMVRATFDQALARDEEPFRITDRLTGEEHQLSRPDFDDLCKVHLYDWLEQAPRSRHGWSYRRTAYQGIAQRLGKTAQDAYGRTFAAEPVS